MDFWDYEKVQKALPDAKFYDFDGSWHAAGFRIWHVGGGGVILVRTGDEKIGAIKENLIPILPAFSAIICTDYNEVKDLNKPTIVIKDYKKAFLALANFIRKTYTGKVIAITGSAGKSTVTQMIYNILSQKNEVSCNLNHKNTLIAICWNMTYFDINAKYWVLETSIGHGSIAVPDIAVVTNLTEVHLKTGQSIEDIAEAKSKIFSTMKAGGYAVLNREMPCYGIFEKSAKDLNIITTGEREGVDVRVLEDGFEIKGKKYQCKALPKHIMYNIAQALAISLIEGMDVNECISTLENFAALEGRGEVIELDVRGNRMTLVDESYNANPLSMKCAIEAFGKQFCENKVLILGDMAEIGDRSKELHLSLYETIKNANPYKIILCGKEIKCLQSILSKDFELYYFEDVLELIRNHFRILSNGDNIFIKSSHSTGLYRLAGLFKAQFNLTKKQATC